MGITLRRRFTEGDCHILAREIHNLTGWDICTFTTDSYEADLHAFVRLPDGRFLDIDGISTRQELTKRWKCYRIRVWESMQELSAAAPEWIDYATWSASPKIAMREAKRLVCQVASS